MEPVERPAVVVVIPVWQPEVEEELLPHRAQATEVKVVQQELPVGMVEVAETGPEWGALPEAERLLVKVVAQAPVIVTPEDPAVEVEACMATLHLPISSWVPVVELEEIPMKDRQWEVMGVTAEELSLWQPTESPLPLPGR